MDQSLPIAYRPYQSKRHSRTNSSFSSPLSSPGIPSRSGTPTKGYLSTSPSKPPIHESDWGSLLNGNGMTNGKERRRSEEVATTMTHDAILNGQPTHVDIPSRSTLDRGSDSLHPEAVSPSRSALSSDSLLVSPSSSPSDSVTSTPAVSPLLDPSRPAALNRPSSTFRHVPLRSTQPTTPSPLRPGSLPQSRPHLTSITRSFDKTSADQPTASGPSLVIKVDPPRSSSSPIVVTRNALPSPVSGASHDPSPDAPIPPTKDPPIPQQRPPIISIASAPVQAKRETTTPPPPTFLPAQAPPPSAPSHRPTPYRAGFQPKGVYRLRTDEFMVARNKHVDERKVDDRRLERRLEKLIALHFSSEASSRAPALSRTSSARSDGLRGSNPVELWRGLVDGKAAGSTPVDIRAAEQSIAAWQDDASVTNCPLCTATFHPLANRKHHCRLCGRVVCGLPPKQPIRPTYCSFLITVEPRTGKIVEVPDVIAYGVTKKGEEGKAGKGKEPMKGVRICRDCKTVVARQQYMLEAARVPTINRLYDVLMQLEKETEESLPQFQDLVLTLSKGEAALQQEASSARKHLLDTFADYDAVSKRIRALPCTPGTAQDRLQRAIFMRANSFLQANMFPLQTLPKFKKHAKTASKGSAAAVDFPEESFFDADSELAKTLQPLLEQEALLDQYVQEATEQRKFEDAKALKLSLEEIRQEINRLVGSAAG